MRRVWAVAAGLIAVLVGSFVSSPGVAGAAPDACVPWAFASNAAQSHGLWASAELAYAGANTGMLRARASVVGPWEGYDLCQRAGTNLYYLRSRGNGRFVSAELGYTGGLYGMLRARATAVGGWELFTLTSLPGNVVALRSNANGRYVSAELGYAGANSNMLRARATTVGGWEKFLPPTRTPSWGKTQVIDPILHPALSGISCATEAWCLAVDQRGQLFTYHETGGWSSPITIDPSQKLTSVSCASTSFCAAVDARGYALTFDGTAWSTPAAVDGNAPLTSISCRLTTFCIAVDSAGDAVDYDGSTWSPPANIDGSAGGAFSVSCASTTFCVAVDGNGDALQFDGATWTKAVVDTGVRIDSVSCPTATFCMAVDAHGATLHFDGSSWSTPARITNLINALVTVSCTSATLCVTFNDIGDRSVYDGATWSGYVDYVLSSPVGVSCTPSGVCVGLGADGYSSHYGGPPAVTHHVYGGLGDISDIACSGPNACAVVDTSGHVDIYRNGAWAGPTLLDRDASVLSVSCPALTTCMAFDERSSSELSGPRLLGYDGNTWTPARSDSIGDIHCPTTTFCSILAGGVQLIKFNSGTKSWTAISAGLTTDQMAVSCASPTFCVSFDGYGTTSIFNGTRWTQSPAQFSPYGNEGIACVTTRFCIATEMGRVTVFNGTSWSPGRYLGIYATSIACASTRFCVAAGGGQVSAFNGMTWSTPASLGTPETTTAISCPTEGFCAVAGAGAGTVALTS